MGARVGKDAADETIIAALVRDGDWTEHGAREVVQLARKYGTSILRNALALASAMQIEDGEAGL
jgi:spore coat protein CotH